MPRRRPTASHPPRRRAALRFPVGVLLAVAALGCVAGCVADDDPGTRRLQGSVVVEGLVGPTQLAVGPDGTWWVAQLNGGENDGTGQVLRIDPAAPDSPPEVVVDGLDKPTGVAVFAGELWIMERDRLTRGPLDHVNNNGSGSGIGGGNRDEATDGTVRTVVIDGLPTNGRSEGALTVDGDRLLFDTSGSLDRSASAGTPVEGSGVLWSVDAAGVITEVASGFKHAYAQVRAADGTLFTTEIGDGRYDGRRPDDELVAVVEGVDHGWPRCVGDNVAVIEFGGTEDDCAQVPPSHAVFPAGATPTSVVVAPWDPSQLLVALWNRGEVVAVPVDEPGRAPVVVYDGAEHPQHLAVDPGADTAGVGTADAESGRVLLTDHLAGTIVALAPQDAASS